MAKSKFSRIVTPDEPDYVQTSLFAPEVIQSSFPPIKDDIADILSDRLIGEPLGLDLEFNSKTGKPSILGVATPRMCAAVPWTEYDANFVSFYGGPYVGHSVISADKPVWDKALGIETSLDDWEDSMIAYYLCNADFCQAPGKAEDADDAGALGLMNLWTMASLYTEVPQWKVCRGKACSGPCPRHDVFGYCAVDAWAGLVSYLALRDEMKRKGIPE